MANRVKTISKYSGSAWGTEVPIGADATNVDMTTAPSDYDSSSSETSKVLIGTNDVKVIASDTDLTAWGKFNRFRRRVSNKFADYFATANIKTSYQTTGANGDVYSTSLLNSYFSNVIGYTGSSAPTAGSVASQLESLNSKAAYCIQQDSPGFVVQTVATQFINEFAIDTSIYRIGAITLAFGNHPYIVGGVEGIEYLPNNIARVSGFLRSITSSSANVTFTMVVMVCPGTLIRL